MFQDAAGQFSLHANGVFRIVEDTLTTPTKVPDAIDGFTVTGFEQTGEGLLIAATDGLYELRGSDLLKIPSEPADIGFVGDIVQRNDQILVGAEHGIFELADGSLQRIKEGAANGDIPEFIESAGDLFINDNSKLVRFDDLAAPPMTTIEDAGAALDVAWMPDGLHIATHKGVFLFDGEEVTKTSAGRRVGAASKFFDTSEGLLVKTERGVYWSENGKISALGWDRETGAILTIYEAGDVILIGAENGVFQLFERTPINIYQEEGFIVHSFHKTDDGFLVGTSQGLFLLGEESLDPIDGAPTGLLGFAFFDVGEDLFMKVGKRLYRLEGENLTPIQPPQQSSILRPICSTGKGVLNGVQRGIALIQELAARLISETPGAPPASDGAPPAGD